MLFHSHNVTFFNVVVRNSVSVGALRGFAFYCANKIAQRYCMGIQLTGQLTNRLTIMGILYF